MTTNKQHTKTKPHYILLGVVQALSIPGRDECEHEFVRDMNVENGIYLGCMIAMKNDAGIVKYKVKPDDDACKKYADLQKLVGTAFDTFSEAFDEVKMIVNADWFAGKESQEYATAAKKLLSIKTDKQLIAVRGAEAHQAVKQRTQFWTQPGGYQDVVLDGFVIAEITNCKITFEQLPQEKEAMQNVADLLHNTKHESSRQACRRFMAALIHFGA